MKNTLKASCIFLLLVSLHSCQNETSMSEENTKAVATEAEKNIPVKPDTLSFIHCDGLHNEDTTAIQIIIQDQDVEGSMMYFPYEKDARIGYIKGRIDANNIIHAGWVYEQEGMEDQVEVEFQLKDNSLLEKDRIYNATSGKEELNHNDGYIIEYKKIPTNKFPEHMIYVGIKHQL